MSKVISKFFPFNGIPLNATDSEPYYQIIVTIAEAAGLGIKGLTRYQIGNTYVEEEMQELEVCINTLKAK